MTIRTPRRRVHAAVLAALATVLSLVAVPPGRATTAGGVPTPTVSQPPAGIHSHALWDSWYDLGPFGYTDAEYFVSGTAHDTSGTAAPYTTRIIVTRPVDAKRFNGTAVLDWVNVTAQFENAVDTMETRQMLMREGFMYVHVSAQSAGICCTPLTPKVWDPVRYAALSHPGDAYANDIFSQVAQAIRTGGDVTGQLHVRHVLAVGQSQSCSKLDDFVESDLWPAGLVDGVLLHGCNAAKSFPKPLPVKVLHLLSDNEANPAGPPDDPNYRLWEIAGTAHSDFFIGYQSVFGHGPRTMADAPRATKAGYDDVMRTAGNYGEQVHPMDATCVLAGSTMPMHYAASSAIDQLNRWVRADDAGDGFSPRNGPRFTFDASGRLAKDAYLNTLGGIRMPPIDVPVATYDSTRCPLGGLTVPFTDVQLRALYPTFDVYDAAMKARTDTAVRDSWLLPEDAVDLMARVCAAKVRWEELAGSCPAYTPPRA